MSATTPDVPLHPHTDRWVFRSGGESGRVSRAERREVYGDDEARRACADASEKPDPPWHRTTSSSRIITLRIRRVKAFLSLGEFAHDATAGIFNDYVALQVWAGTPALDQAILTEFINEGHFGHHVRKMRQVYSDRSQLLTEEANRRLSGLLDVEHAQSGMRTVAWIKTRVPEMVLTRRAEHLGLEVVPISSYGSKYEQKPALMLGFAGCNASEIKRGVSVLEAVLSR